MARTDAEVIEAFNEQVNMSIEELEAWLDNPESEKAGTGVGHDSGRRIVEILKKNPGKDPKKYDEEDLQHMHKVVAYNSRHLAQEDHLKETKTLDELEKTKSTISLRNWGHDPVKVKKQEEGALDNKDKGAGKHEENTQEEGDEDAEGEPDTEAEGEKAEAKQDGDMEVAGDGEAKTVETNGGEAEVQAQSGENEDADTGDKRKRGKADSGTKGTKKRQTAPSRRARGGKATTTATTRKTRSSSKADGDAEE